MKKIYTILLLIVLTLSITPVCAKDYIDINSPAFRRFPIAVSDLGNNSIGKELANIIGSDLDYCGIFGVLDKKTYVEAPDKEFNPDNWKPLSVDAVVKGDFDISDAGGEKIISANLYVYDVLSGKKIFQKRYNARLDILRLLAHKMANDVYMTITGRPGVFDTKIAYVATEGDKKVLYIMDWDGERSRRVTGGNTLVLRPRWSPDGLKLVYSALISRQWAINLVDLTNLNIRRLYSSDATNLVGDFMPNGSYVLLSSTKDGPADIYTLRIDSGELSRVTSTNYIEVSPTIAANGKIAIVSNRSGNPQLYLMESDGYNINGNNFVRITFEGKYNTSPNISQDGERVVYAGMIDGKNQIFSIKSDGTDLRQLTGSGNNEEPSFSSDGRFITFVSDRLGFKGVFIMRFDGSGQKLITSERVRAFGPSWSPK